MAPIIFAFRPAHFRTAPSVVIAVALLATTVGCNSRHSAQSRGHLDFNQDVQPILASNCFSCHGPDPEMRKANLRLDLEESAFKKRPGKPDAIVHQATALADIKFGRSLDKTFATTNRLRTEGTDALLAASREAGVRRFVAQSFAPYLYARQGGPIKTEADFKVGAGVG